MAKIPNGFSGFITGKVGNLVYYVRDGKNLVRKIGKNDNPPTEAQLLVRLKMKVIVQFLKPLLAFINAGFMVKAKGTDKSPYNFAVKYNKGCLMGVYPDIVIDYSKVILSEGSLMGAEGVEVDWTEEGLRFTWDTGPYTWPDQNDQVMLLAYFPLEKKAIYLLAGAKRRVGMQVLTIPEDLRGQNAETYVSFVSEDRKCIAKSKYLGLVTS